MRFFLVVALVLLLPFSFAVCVGNITHYVPAVVGTGGGLVNVTMDLVPGSGKTFVSVYPRTGLSTQESVDEAVSYATHLSNLDEKCDVLVDFGTKPTTNLIDGPSAGTALTVMAYALLHGTDIRNDTIITGTIEPDGSVGLVGGLYEKASGAASIGAKYFITPVENFYEILLLRNMEKQYGIHILQAKKVGDVIDFMVDNKSIPQEQLSQRNRPIPDPLQYNDSLLTDFGPIAQHMLKMEKDQVDSVVADGNDTIAIKSFFENEVERQKKIADKGYYFSSANEAFLNFIDLSTIKVILATNTDFSRKKGDVGKCLTGIKRPVLTDQNYQWVIGADLRQAWAYDKYNNITSEEKLTDERFVEYNDLMYAQAWCNVAKELLAAAPTGGTPINETAWKELASQKISEAKLIGTTNDDTKSRLDIASSSFSAGHYGAALYDAVYVIETENNSNSTVVVAAKPQSLWGAVYRSHAAFLISQNQTLAAGRVERFANSLEEIDRQMRSVNLQNIDRQLIPVPISEQSNLEPAQLNPLLIFVSISIFLLIVLVLFRWGTHGDNSTRPGKTFRVKQKKG